MKTTNIAIFDFDGTITNCDSFVAFSIYAIGIRKWIVNIILCFPWLIAYKLKLYPNWKAKQRLFSLCFKSMNANNFNSIGQAFALKHKSILNLKAIQTLEEHIKNKHKIYIITASMENWVKPLLEKYSSLHFITTKPEITNGKLTGKFSTPNCYGKEKARRFLIEEPRRNEYILHVYGDSSGDKEILELADYSYYRVF